MLNKDIYKKHKGAFLALVMGLILGIFVDSALFILSIIVGIAFDNQKKDNCN